MIKIGDFSKMSFVTVQALRYYDDIGLLKPVKVDELTGYRFYMADQLIRANHITALKKMGLPLEDIAFILNDVHNLESIKKVLTVKRTDILQRLADEKSRLNEVEKILRKIEDEGKLPKYQVVMKTIEPQLVAAVRAVLPNYSGQLIGGMFADLLGFINDKGLKIVGPTMMLYNDPDYREENADIEVSAPINKAVDGSGRVSVYTMPVFETVACLVYKGRYEDMGEAYNALMSWVATNGYQLNGICREVYLVSPADTPDPDNYVSELQVPVKKP
jgi:effector-binding domain-containing protein